MSADMNAPENAVNQNNLIEPAIVGAPQGPVEEVQALLNELEVQVLTPNNQGRGAEPMEVEQRDNVAAALAEIELDLARERDDVAALCAKIDMVGITGEHEAGYSHVVISDKSIGKDKFKKEGVTIRWIVAKDSMVQVFEQVNKLLLDPNPKQIVVDCFGQFLKTESTGKIMKYLSAIRNRMKDFPRHKVVFASFLFSPVNQPWWDEISSLNVLTRNLNLSLNMTPLQLHKSLMKKVKGHRQLCVRGDDWEEHRKGTGLGTVLSWQGTARIMEWIGTHMLTGMHKPVDTKTALLLNEDCPSPLYKTPGYKNYTMVQLLKQLGTYDVELARPGNRNRRFSSGSNRSYKSGDDLRPRLPGVSKKPWKDMRSDRSVSGSTTWRRASYDRQGDDEPCHYKIKMVELQGTVADLEAKLELVRTEKEKKKYNENEISYSARCDRYAHELEWMAHDRRVLSEKHIVLEEKNARLVDDRDRLRDLRDDWRDRARELEDEKKEREREDRR